MVMVRMAVMFVIMFVAMMVMFFLVFRPADAWLAGIFFVEPVRGAVVACHQVQLRG